MKELSPLPKRKYTSSIVLGIVFLIIFIGILLFSQKKNQPTPIEISKYSAINNICELATLKSFYHNVVMYEKEPDGGNKFVNDILLWPFGEYTKVGYKQFWMEYSGIIETGIQASQIRISEPDSQGIVEIYIPDAEVLNVYADQDSLTEPLSENGWFTKISGKEKTEAFSTAQSAMRQEAENDQALLYRAKENAKVLLEQYVVKTGASMGIELSVKWVEAP